MSPGRCRAFDGDPPAQDHAEATQEGFMGNKPLKITGKVPKRMLEVLIFAFASRIELQLHE